MHRPASCTLKTVTLGCKVNQYETEYVRQGLARLGYREAGDGEPADLCVVNTCTVTAEGDPKSRKAIRQLASENPGAQIIVMGCYATRRPDEVAALPGVVEVVTDKRELPELLARFGLVDLPERHLDLRAPASGLRQGAGRLPHAVQLLHHPQGAARAHQAAGRRGARRNRAGWSTTGTARSC